MFNREDIKVLIDNVPALVSFFDNGHVCRYANEYHRYWYGRSPDELIGLHMLDFLGDEGYKSRAPHLQQVALGFPVAFDACVPHLHGEWRDAAIRYIPKTGAYGFEGFYILVFDVAVWKERFRGVFDGTIVGFVELSLPPQSAALLAQWPSLRDAKDEDSWRKQLAAEVVPALIVQDLNAKAAMLFKAPASQAIGRPLLDWCGRGGARCYLLNLLVAFARGEPSFQAETALIDAQDGEIPAEISCAFPKLGSDRLIVSLSDISARIARERELALVQDQLTHAARISMLGELTASIAHEVNQPLSAVITDGNAAIRWLNRPEPDLDEARAAISHSISEGMRAADIIQRIRAMSTKGDMVRTPLNLNDVVSEARRLIAQRVSGLGVSLQLELEEPLPTLMADRIQAQQTIINLVMNAAQALQDTPEPKEIVVASRREDGFVAITVSDNGPGISDAQAKTMFDAFFTTKSDGMGIGLSIVKRIMEAHEGSVQYARSAQGGAQFTLRFPTT